MVKWIAEEGFNTNVYFGNDTTLENYMMMNGCIVNSSEKVEINEKIMSAYWYLNSLREDCKDMSLREFNISRFSADFEVLYQSTKGM